MSESDTMFNERHRICTAVQLMLSTDPSYENSAIASNLKMQIWRGWWYPVTIRWLVADFVYGSRTRRRPTSPKRSRLSSEGVLSLCTLLSLVPSLPRPESAGLLRLSYVENITNMTSHDTKGSLIAAIPEYLPSCRWHL